MGDMQVGVLPNADDKGFYGLLEDRLVKTVASSNTSLQVSVSFGRFENDSLSWEKFSAFSPNKSLEEVGKFATPGSVAQKKAFFEARYKKIAERKAEIMDHQEKPIDMNTSFRSVLTDQTTNKTVTSKETPPSKEIKHMMKTTKKPAAPISIAPPRMYKPVSKVTSCSTSQSSAKKDHLSSLLRNKQAAPKSLHMSMSPCPSASDPTALTTTRKSLIMERMGDKDIVKRAFKTFQKSYDFKASVDVQKPALKQNAAKPTSTNTRGLKSNVRAEKQQKEGVQLSKSGVRPVEKTRLQKNPKAGVIDAKTRRDSPNPKAISMQGSLPVRTLQKGLH